MLTKQTIDEQIEAATANNDDELIRRLCLLELLQADDENVGADDISVSSYDEKTFVVGSSEYLVCTEAEADELWEQSLDNYLEECVYPELPESMVNYFDDKAWKRDARFDGRGHCISSYDGSEYDAREFVVFRMN